MAKNTKPTSETREFEAHEAQRPAMADREPTPAEEAAAAGADGLDPEQRETIQEQYERGANAKGEGRI